jgi:hypothetical protein
MRGKDMGMKISNGKNEKKCLRTKNVLIGWKLVKN